VPFGESFSLSSLMLLALTPDLICFAHSFDLSMRPLALENKNGTDKPASSSSHSCLYTSVTSEGVKKFQPSLSLFVFSVLKMVELIQQDSSYFIMDGNKSE
jgi:hypothetical protein